MVILKNDHLLFNYFIQFFLMFDISINPLKIIKWEMKKTVRYST